MAGLLGCPLREVLRFIMINDASSGPWLETSFALISGASVKQVQLFACFCNPLPIFPLCLRLLERHMATLGKSSRKRLAQPSSHLSPTTNEAKIPSS